MEQHLDASKGLHIDTGPELHLHKAIQCVKTFFNMRYIVTEPLKTALQQSTSV